MLVTYINHFGEIPYGEKFSVPLEDILGNSSFFNVRYGSRLKQTSRLDYLFDSAETLEDTIFLSNLIQEVCSHKKMVFFSVDREAQALPFSELKIPREDRRIGTWLWEGERFDDLRRKHVKSIFHKAVFSGVLENFSDFREVRIEMDENGKYCYAVYKYESGTPVQILKVKSFEDRTLEELVDVFLAEPVEKGE